MKTYLPKSKEIKRLWYHVDAEGKTLGRLAGAIADILRGKHKPIFSPSLDTGDFVIVTNAEKIAVTGDKMTQKTYVHHTGYPGGFRSKTLAQLLQDHPTRVIEKAVWGMLPHNKLGRAQFKKLKVYTGAEHPHSAQLPRPLEMKEKGERKWR